MWTHECDETFHQLKDVLCCQPVLQTPDFCKPYKLANTTCMRVMLRQELNYYKTTLKFIIFSKKFIPPQKNCAFMEKVVAEG